MVIGGRITSKMIIKLNIYTLKKIIISIVFIIAHLLGQAQKTGSLTNGDYYFSFWKQNLDTLCLQGRIPFDFKSVYPSAVIPGYSEMDYAEIIKSLNSELPLRYDSRVGDILSFYIQNGQLTSWALAYSQYMEPQFLKYIKAKNLPQELKYLPFALAAMNYKATGETGAAGLWQLLYSSARKEGLTVDSYVDERLNVNKASMAAASELKQLFDLYQNWELALGAYACGPSNINKTIRRKQNVMDYYQLYDQLPVFGRDIVPALTAAIILSKQYETFDMKIPKVNFAIPQDTIEVSKRLHFAQLAAVLQISIDSIRFLNPQYKYDIVPAMGQVYKVNLPKGNLIKFIALVDSIYLYKDSVLFKMAKPVIMPPPSKERQYAKYEPPKVPNGSALVYYHIKEGDNLGYVASWYDVSISKIEDWNNIYDPRRIQIGKTLKIYVDEEKEAYYAAVDDLSFSEKQNRVGKQAPSNTNSSTDTKPKTPSDTWVYHTVKTGESPYVIAQKYPGVSADDILKWNNIKDARYIQVGQKLKIKQ